MIMKETLKALLDTEDKQLRKLNEIVLKSIEEEKLIAQKLFEFEDSKPGFRSRLADRIALFGGSWAFIITFFVVISIWMFSNAYLLTRPFDAYPFIFLNLFLSCIAALQAPIIMMSQNRKDEKDRARSINDYLVNLKAEIEVRNLHQKIDLLISEQMKTMFELQQLQMELMEEIRAELPGEKVF
jgi:uncharacterized membrane protein